MAGRKQTKGQRMIDKILPGKLAEQSEPYWKQYVN